MERWASGARKVRNDSESGAGAIQREYRNERMDAAYSRDFCVHVMCACVYGSGSGSHSRFSLYLTDLPVELSCDG